MAILATRRKWLLMSRCAASLSPCSRQRLASLYSSCGSSMGNRRILLRYRVRPDSVTEAIFVLESTSHLLSGWSIDLVLHGADRQRRCLFHGPAGDDAARALSWWRQFRECLWHRAPARSSAVCLGIPQFKGNFFFFLPAR